MKTRVAAKIVGRVQGVGFRPTVYRYATELGLGGFVCNEPEGVTLEVEGEEEHVAAFFQHLTSQPPKQAVIANIKTHTLPERGYRFFAVVDSKSKGAGVVHIAPDLAVCDDCVRELLDATDPRHEYPFINCTNCGPRFTIIRDLPYDRALTSMAGFTMCPSCRAEYEDPADRRFHAQPDACPECGPQLELRVAGGEPTREAVLAKVSNLLRRGRIVAIKGLGGYHLVCDAFSQETVSLLRERKHRPHKPFAVMFRDLAALRQYCDVSEVEEAELLSDARPIVIVRRRMTPGQGYHGALAHGLAPDTDTLGAFLPYTPVQHLLLRDFEALVMTSCNLAEKPIVSLESELVPFLGGIVDAALTHDRAIVHKCDDSVVRVVKGQRQFFRRARGYVPNPIRFAPTSPALLAVGGELKNTFCLAREGYAFLSQHIGDLKDHSTYEFLAHEIGEWQRLMRVTPEAIVHDLHPGYLSTRFAKAHPTATKIAVQHHHAHIASVMAEHDLHEPVIGIALDGTGYGTDGTVWGGELLVADRVDFERVAHFKQYPLPGSDQAIEEPWRMAASVLLQENFGLLNRRAVTVQKMITAEFNSPLTSSAGRLFDAVAALLGLCDKASYEGQAAIRLEAVADPRVRERYEFQIETRWRPWTLDFGPTIQDILLARRAGVAISEIAARFHNTVAAAVVQVARYLRGQRLLNQVCLSGGVFQNELLLHRVVEDLQSRRFKVYTNTLVPPNDGGLALGQVAVASARLQGHRQPARSRRAKERVCV